MTESHTIDLPTLSTTYTTAGHPAVREIAALPGDASARRYFRVTHVDDTTSMLMQMPKGAASLSEEISTQHSESTLPPFLQIHATLERLQLAVPRVLFHAPATQQIALEDLGDTLLFDVVHAADTPTRLRTYEQAIDLLVQLQTATAKLAPKDSIAMQRTFDDTLLNWEFDHFREFGLDARGVHMFDGHAKRFEELTRALTEQITELDYSFTHRDFQSRNLMMTPRGIAMIDFQDALRGPYIYDLVSLLRDSYVELSTEEVDHLVTYYAEKRGKPAAQVRAHFDLVTVQRKLKDAGRFVYIDQVKGNPKFLPFIPASLNYVWSAMDRSAPTKDLRDLLRKYVPEWKEHRKPAAGAAA